MAVRVIADRMAGRCDGAQQRRLALRAFADREERGVHARLREQIEDLRRPARIRTVVERQVDLLAHARSPGLGSLTLSLFKLRTSAVRVSQ